MKLKFYTSSLVFFVILSICILAGCSDDKKSNSTEDNGKKNRSAVVDMSSWPDDLPKFKGGKLFQIRNNKDTGVFNGAVFGQIKNPKTAYKNYKAALINKGWVLDHDSTNEYTWAGGYVKDSKYVNVNVQKDGSAAQIVCIAD